MTDMQKSSVTKVDPLKADLKECLDALELQLKSSRWEKEKFQIQQKIDQLKKAYNGAIPRAEIDQELADIARKKQADEQVARLAVQKAEVKDRALQEWIKAGGDPNQFEIAWPSIEQSVMNERVINALVDKGIGARPDVKISL